MQFSRGSADPICPYVRTPMMLHYYIAIAVVAIVYQPVDSVVFSFL